MLVLPEQMIINHAEELYSQIGELMNKGDEVILDVSKVEKTDTACLQLLCVLQKSLNELGHQITWQGNNEVFSTTAKMVGVKEFLNL